MASQFLKQPACVSTAVCAARTLVRDSKWLKVVKNNNVGGREHIKDGRLVELVSIT